MFIFVILWTIIGFSLLCRYYLNFDITDYCDKCDTPEAILYILVFLASIIWPILLLGRLIVKERWWIMVTLSPFIVKVYQRGKV
jgi:hypothetical protein